MMYLEKEPHNIRRFETLYNDKTLRQIYRNFSFVHILSDDISYYIEHLKKCEQLGFSFYFYFIDSYEDYRELIGFSDFSLASADKVPYIDLTFLDSKSIKECFKVIFEEDGYFIVSNNSIRRGSLEEAAYENAIRKECDVEETENKKDTPIINLFDN